MSPSYRPIAGAALLLLMWTGCGDDDSPTPDAGRDAGDEPRAGRSGSSGGGGRSGSGGAAGSDADDGGAGETRAITLRFKAKLGDEDFECGRTYTNQGARNTTVTPRDFRFFVQDVKLIAMNGDEVAVALDERSPVQTKDVAIIDFADRSGGCGAGGNLTNLTITGRVPEGEYTALTFTNGVPEDLNHDNIAMAKPPLQDTSTYWGWASGYRFIMAVVATQAPEGADPAASEADGGSGPEFGPTVLHIGSAGCTGSIAAGFTCSRPYRNRVKLDNFDPESSTIIADLGAVFENVDLTSPLECHGADPECASAYAAFGLNATDGSALTSQTVFRLD